MKNMTCWLKATAFQLARRDLEALTSCEAPEVAAEAHKALADAYTWEDSQETTGLACELLVSVVADLKAKERLARSAV